MHFPLHFQCYWLHVNVIPTVLHDNYLFYMMISDSFDKLAEDSPQGDEDPAYTWYAQR